MPNQLSNVVAQLITNPEVPESIRQQIVAVLLAELNGPRSGTGAGCTSPVLAPLRSNSGPQSDALAAAVATRKLVYVHGICQHSDGFSNDWWATLKPHLAGTFGDGVLGESRLEVVWSDLVNAASSALASAMATAATVMAAAAEQARSQASTEIQEALRDRADQQAMHAAVAASGAVANTALGSLGIPGLNCIDDFSIYLTSDTVRQQILDRFIAVIRPQLRAGLELDIISHSWGTVVAYEGLRQLEDEGDTSKLIRNWFTVGAALSIGPVKLRLREANRSGRKPANVTRWVNLNARGDLIGGTLKDRPFQVNQEFLNLDPVGCGSFLGFVNPVCAHGSYFADDNFAVNRDVFARIANG